MMGSGSDLWYNGANEKEGGAFVFSKKAKSTALVLLNNAVRKLCADSFSKRLQALSAAPDALASPAYASFYTDLCKAVLLEVRKTLAQRSPAHARTFESLVAHPETLYHESVLAQTGIYTFPLMFGMLYFALTKRTPRLEDLDVVQQYFTNFLSELIDAA